MGGRRAGGEAVWLVGLKSINKPGPAELLLIMIKSHQVVNI